jgi:hypothetical protein
MADAFENFTKEAEKLSPLAIIDAQTKVRTPAGPRLKTLSPICKQILLCHVSTRKRVSAGVIMHRPRPCQSATNSQMPKQPRPDSLLSNPESL